MESEPIQQEKVPSNVQPEVEPMVTEGKEKQEEVGQETVLMEDKENIQVDVNKELRKESLSDNNASEEEPMPEQTKVKKLDDNEIDPLEAYMAGIARKFFA